ncbi:hypothetical protein ACFX13_044681 [Malus domestica]|uniref:Uncharacterized protein n=1 Tax=Malus domestica TaxID=3750 RepID=A0A498JAL2_MALDO|nr:hypothetical protein DVH24_006798 [Malus domestica]
MVQSSNFFSFSRTSPLNIAWMDFFQHREEEATTRRYHFRFQLRPAELGSFFSFRLHLLLVEVPQHICFSKTIAYRRHAVEFLVLNLGKKYGEIVIDGKYSEGDEISIFIGGLCFLGEHAVILLFPI